MNEPQVITLSMKSKVPNGYKLINVTIKGTEKYRLLSPAMISNVFCYSSLSSVCMQNAWTYSQVYPDHDDGGVPKYRPEGNDWYTWRDRGFARKTATYYPMSGDRTQKPLYTWFNESYFAPVEARKYVFCTLYLRSIRGNQAMKHLQKLYRDGVKLAIRDFDAYLMADGETYEDVLHNLDRPFGCAFVIKNELERE